jgi:RHS repeat-associated protein
LDIAYEQIDGGAEEHDYMMREYTVKEADYAYVYCSNESPTQVDVYFDDVVMTYTLTNIIQYNEYYPFGLQTANSWTRENVTGNNFLANGATELNATTGLYDLDFRNYDPVLGRMNGVDPMAAKYSGLSPYNYSFNNPAVFNDPTGADPPQTVNYSSYVTQYYTGYTYDDRLDYTYTAVWHDGQGWRNEVAGATAFLTAATGYGRGFQSMSFGLSEHSAAYYNQVRNDAFSMGEDSFIMEYGYELWAHGKNYTQEGDKAEVFHVEYYFLKPISSIRKFDKSQQGGGPIITVTNSIVGSTYVKGYPNNVYDENGSAVLYEVPLYEIRVSGYDEGNFVTQNFKAIRFGVYHNKQTGRGPSITKDYNGVYEGSWKK